MSHVLKELPPTLTVSPTPDLHGRLSGAEALQLVSQVAEAVRALHDSGQLHGGLSFDAIHVDASTADITLLAANQPRAFGGPFSSPEHCPLELRRPEVLELPADMEAARRRLAEAGVVFDPQRIDVYQLGTLLCRLVTGESVSAYLSSPRTKAGVPPAIQTLIDRALGYQADTRFATVNEFLSAVQQSLADLPPLSPRPPGEELAADTADLRSETAEHGPGESHRDTSPSIASSPSPPDTDIGPRRATPTAPDDALPFTALGHFQIVSRIGHGGMGDVYKGYEPALDRMVAIKVLPSELAREEDFVRRFRAEATAVARLTHPNVVQIHFIGEDHGHHFFAMQFVEGESLADFLRRRRRLNTDEALAILEQTLAGLAAAHKQGIIHRDIKPANILLDRENRRALLADFGLVKSVAAGTKMTATGVVMGTVDYISPEQGRGQDVDARSDLYSIGVLLYQLLSGDLPFAADSPTAMIFQHVYEQPKPLQDVAPDVPAPLCAVVHKLLAKSPDQRHQSADELLDELRAFRTGQRPAAAPAGRRQTVIIQAPRFEEPPPLPTDLETEAPVVWWRQVRDRWLDLLRRRTPEFVKRLQNTQQQVDGAVAEYEHRRNELQALVAEGEEALAELKRQAADYREAAIAAAQRAEASADETEIREAWDEKETCERSADELAAQIAEQEEQLETMHLRLAQVNATLQRVRGQRDALAARLKVAQARVQLAAGRPKRRPLAIAVRIAVGVAAGTLILFAALVFWPGKLAFLTRFGGTPSAMLLPSIPTAVAPFDAQAAKQFQTRWAESLGVPVVHSNSIGLKLVLIPPGEFDMGSTPEEVARLQNEGRRQNAPSWYLDRTSTEAPKHHVKITMPFYLSLGEVTQAEYERVMGSNPSEFKGDPSRPVDNVSYNDAVEFCRRLRDLPEEKAAGAVYRLPTEAEWEYARRAGTTTRFGFGDDAAELDKYATYAATSQGHPQPLGPLQANPWGLFDMSGNVWEWCADWSDPGYYGESPAEDPPGPDSGEARVLRGGSWRDALPDIFSAAHRGWDRPDARNSCLGFRVARTFTLGTPGATLPKSLPGPASRSGSPVASGLPMPQQLVFLPNGSGFAAVHQDASIMFYQFRADGGLQASSQQLRHLQNVNALAFAPDGRLFATAESDAVIRIWEASGDARRTELRRLQGHAQPASQMVFSPDGNQLLSASPDRTLRLWDVATETEIRRSKVQGIRETFETIDWSRDGTRVLIGGRIDGASSMSIWNLFEDTEETVFDTSKRPTTQVAFSRAEDQVFAVHMTFLGVYDARTGQAIRQMGKEIRSAALAPAAYRAWTADDRGVLSLWDLRSGAVVQTFPGDGQAVGAIALSPDGSRALSTRSDGSVQSWDLPKPPPPANQLLVMAGNGPVTCVAFSPDGAFAVGNIRDDLCLWNATDGSQVRTYPIQTPIASAAFSTDGRTIVYGTGAKNGKFGNVALREVVSRRGGREERRFQGHLGQVAAVAITPDAQRAVSASADGTVRVWDVPLEKETHKLELGLPIVCVALTKGENEVLIGANDTSLRLWKWDAGQEVTRLDGHASAVLSVAVSADGKRAASASADRTVCVWDLPGKQRIAQLEGHSGPVNSVAISQHGLTVLSGSDDGTVRLWDVQTAKEVLRFEGHTGPVRCVAMSADGMRAISGGEDATLRVWKLPIRVQ